MIYWGWKSGKNHVPENRIDLSHIVLNSRRILKCQVISWTIHYLHHHWLDSPVWTLAFLRSFNQSSLFIITFLHSQGLNIVDQTSLQSQFGPSSFSSPFRSGIKQLLGRAIAQPVSRWLPTAAARVRSRVWSSGISGGQSGAGAGFLRVLRFPLPIFIPRNSPSS
jgi:hypothetical protein